MRHAAGAPRHRATILDGVSNLTRRTFGTTPGRDAAQLSATAAAPA